MLPSNLQCTRHIPTSKNSPAQNFNSAEGEKPLYMNQFLILKNDGISGTQM